MAGQHHMLSRISKSPAAGSVMAPWTVLACPTPMGHTMPASLSLPQPTSRPSGANAEVKARLDATIWRLAVEAMAHPRSDSARRD